MKYLWMKLGSENFFFLFSKIANLEFPEDAITLKFLGLIITESE